MFDELRQIAKSVATIFTLPGVGQLVPFSVGCQDGLKGELLVTVLAGVQHSGAVG